VSEFYLGNGNVNRPFSLLLKLLDRPLMGGKPLLLSLVLGEFVALVDLPMTSQTSRRCVGVASLDASPFTPRPVGVRGLNILLGPATLAREGCHRFKELRASDVSLLGDHSVALTCIRAEASSERQMSTLILAASSFHFSSSSISMASCKPFRSS